jgi:hypothetical protein
MVSVAAFGPSVTPGPSAVLAAPAVVASSLSVRHMCTGVQPVVHA